LQEAAALTQKAHLVNQIMENVLKQQNVMVKTAFCLAAKKMKYVALMKVNDI